MPNVGIHYAQMWVHIFVWFAILKCGYTFAMIGADKESTNTNGQATEPERKRTMKYYNVTFKWYDTDTYCGNIAKAECA